MGLSRQSPLGAYEGEMSRVNQDEKARQSG
jgi:hypothetical protein